MKKIFVGILLFLSFGLNISFADYDYCNPKNEGIEKLFSEEFFERENVAEWKKGFFERLYKDKEFICFDGEIATIKKNEDENENILAKDFEYIENSYKNNNHTPHFRIKNSFYYNPDSGFYLKKDFSKYFELKDGDIKSEEFDIFKIKDKFLGDNAKYFYEILDGKEVNIDLVLDFDLDKKTFWEKGNYFGDENKVYFIDKYYYENFGKSNLKDKLFLLEKADPKSFKVFDNGYYYTDKLAYDKNAIYKREKRNEIDFDYDTLELYYAYNSNILLDKNRGYLLNDEDRKKLFNEIKIISKYKANLMIYFYENTLITYLYENKVDIIETLFFFVIILTIIFFIFFRNSIIPFLTMISSLVIVKILYFIFNAKEIFNFSTIILLVFIFHFIIYIGICGKKYGIKLFNSIFLIVNVFIYILFYQLSICNDLDCFLSLLLLGMVIGIIYIITSIIFILIIKKQYKTELSKEKEIGIEKQKTKKLDF